MTLPTAALVTTKYLYGQDSVPGNLLSSDLIRQSTLPPSEINVITQEFMTSGGGRFAVGAQFSLVNLFFTSASTLAPRYNDGNPSTPDYYTKEEIAKHFGLANSYYGWDMFQSNYQDGTDDYAERTYIYQTQSFQIADGAKFIVMPDGTARIENFGIIPNKGVQENFDFDGGWLSNLVNPLIEPSIDPSGIGRTININYSGDVTRVTYEQANYWSDQTKISNWGGFNPVKLVNDINNLIDNLWSSGVTKFLDSENRPILYGTDNGEVLAATDVQSYPKLSPYFTNGVVLITGKGIDFLNGSGGNDKLYGGAGNDTLTGGTGDDQFIINSGDGNDIIADTTLDVGDRVVYNGGILSGEATNLANGNYKLNGYVLEKQGNDLYITSDGNATGVTVRAFFPAEYDDTQVHTMMGITIPAEKNDDKIDISINQIPNDTGRVSPIVLDLNGDGLKYIAYNYSYGKNAHFDIDNDGFAEGMEWLNANDGFLVRDTNGNGKIDNQKEMFGDDSGTTAYYKLAQNDNFAGINIAA